MYANISRRKKQTAFDSLAIKKTKKKPIFVAPFKWFYENFLESSTHLFTYLIGHNNPIKGYRPTATYSSTQVPLLLACHQSIIGLPRFGPRNEYNVVRFADLRRSSHQKHVWPNSSPLPGRAGY